MAQPPTGFGLEQILAALGSQPLANAPSLPIQRPIVPGVMPQSGQGNAQGALNAVQILELMRQPKLGLK